MGKGTAADAWKTMFSILLLIVSILVALYVAQVTLLWDWLNPLTRQLATWPVMQPHVEVYRLGQERWNEVETRQQALDVRELDLDGRFERLQEEQRQLRAAQNELELEQVRLAEWEEELEAWAEALAETAERMASLDNLREMYAAMRPQEAAAIMADLEPAEVAALLSDMSPRQASGILAALPRDVATTVSRRLGLESVAQGGEG